MSQVVEHLLSLHKTLGLILEKEKKKKYWPQRLRDKKFRNTTLGKGD
jgi:hypothetical protein